MKLMNILKQITIRSRSKKAENFLFSAFYFENAEYIEDRGERFYGKVEREPQTFYLGASHVTIAELEQLENSNIHHQVTG